MNIPNTIDKIIQYAVYVTEPEEIILFGSIANGTSDVYSDVDLLIISDSNKREAISKISNFVYQLSLKTDILIYSRDEFEKLANQPFSFLKAAQKFGRVVYKKK